MKTKKQYNNFGFTLLEMIIAMGIFIVLFSLTLGIYSYAIKAERKTVQFARLQKEGQLVMQVLAKKMRNSRVDYDWYIRNYGVINTEEDKLALINKFNNLTVFKLKDNNIAVCTENDCVDDADFYSIPADDVVVQDLSIFIDPTSDPFINLSSMNEPFTEHPKFTVVVDLLHVDGDITLPVQLVVIQRLGGF